MLSQLPTACTLSWKVYQICSPKQRYSLVTYTLVICSKFLGFWHSENVFVCCLPVSWLGPPWYQQLLPDQSRLPTGPALHRPYPWAPPLLPGGIPAQDGKHQHIFTSQWARVSAGYRNLRYSYAGYTNYFICVPGPHYHQQGNNGFGYQAVLQEQGIHGKIEGWRQLFMGQPCTQVCINNRVNRVFYGANNINYCDLGKSHWECWSPCVTWIRLTNPGRFTRLKLTHSLRNFMNRYIINAYG